MSSRGVFIFTVLISISAHAVGWISGVGIDTCLAADNAQPSRQKNIDFEDEVVEGMNKRPLDSLSQLGDGKRKNDRPHLYKKRGHFRPESSETLREVRFVR